MVGRAKIIGFALAMLLSPLALAQPSYSNGQALWTANGCADCHEFLGAVGIQAIRDQISMRPPAGLSFTKSLDALNAALTGTDLDGDDSSVMLGLFPPGTFSSAQLADIAVFIANMPTPAPTLTYSPFPGPIFPPTAASAMASQSVTVTNTGTAAMIFATNGAAQIASGPYAADFSVTGAECQGMTLQPNAGSCTVTVQFRPAAGADISRTASLALVTTTSAMPTLVPMFGTLQAAAPAATPPAATAPAPGNSANSPSGGAGSLPWQLVSVLLLVLLPGVRRA